MPRHLSTRPLRLLSSLLAASLLLAPSADAQRKKPKKKPAATAKQKAGASKAAPPAAAPAAPAAPEAAPEAEPSPESEAPPPKKKGSKAQETEAPAEPTEEEKDKGKDKASKLPPLLDLEAGFQGFQRHLSYTGDANGNLPAYNLGGAPAVFLGVGLYPIRTSSGGLSAGIEGSFQKGFAIGTTYSAPVAGADGTHTTSASAWSVGARVNFHFGTSTLGLGLQYGAQSFTVDLPDPTAENGQVPDVDYRFIRPNATFRLGLSPQFALLASAGYMVVTQAGEIVSDTYFPKAITTMAGYDLGVGAAWAPLASTKNFEIRPMFGWRRFAFKFNPDPAATYYATAAHDDYLTLSILAGLRF